MVEANNRALKYGLSLTIAESKGEYGLVLEYETSLISGKDADRILEVFATAINNVLADPECPIGEISTRDECVHDLFRATACRLPEKQAIHAWDGRLTYGELETLTNKLARRLASLSVKPEDIIPLCFEKSLWGIVAMIGVAKAGGTFVHLYSLSPVAQKQQIINITAPRLTLASIRNKGMMKSLVPETLVISHDTLMVDDEVEVVTSEMQEQSVKPSNSLYVIFTSGSTGEPKGVVIEHRNFCSAMAANTTRLQILPSARMLQFSSFVFDACTEEIFTALVAGAYVCVPSDDDRMSPEGLTSFMQSAGDPENLVPIGAVGELILEGPILARGYLNRQAETASAFPHIKDWFNGKPNRVYRTGDLVCYTEDGSLRILGRRDTQVKIRGQRVELGEIQRQLDLSPNIRHSLLLQPKSGLLKGRLVAVLSFTRSSSVAQSKSSHSDEIRLVNDSANPMKDDHATTSESLSEIRSFVSDNLPSYMVPDTWCVIEDMPTLPSFKLDRKRSTSSEDDSTMEKLVKAAWSQALEMPTDAIGMTDHFIALGGDSISAMHVARFLSQKGISVRTQDVLRSNSVRELASLLGSPKDQDTAPAKAQSKSWIMKARKLPSVEEIVSEYDSDLSDGSQPNIMTILMPPLSSTERAQPCITPHGGHISTLYLRKSKCSNDTPRGE
ncbi:hypothetical protein GGR50DRAFT_698111 [Xylaria sp. CBS 124048]|nr:hypothetical protein GGR50DRAFT_698111 [Xylaria sp. CBS 124048]